MKGDETWNARLSKVGQVLFLVWLTLTNVLYYAQFRGPFVSRLRMILALWR